MMIPVTKPFLPPREEYQQYLNGIWEREYLTNDGPLVKSLEHKLKAYLGVDQLLYVSNGTIALQLAIKALALKGEVITTPFSYIATTSSIVWEGCTPVFVDIDPKTLNIDPYLIEAAITEETSAILATHVFGNPCDVETIQAIADKYGLKVIYDAAHCFGTQYKGESIFNWGDISTTSFHATKLFHTIEGGAVFTKNKDLFKKIKYMRSFGHDGPGQIAEVGINGKNSEFHAAMGLSNLKYIDVILEKRQKLCEWYNNLFVGLPVETLKIRGNTTWNFSYYPIIFESEKVTVAVSNSLRKKNIFPRRYFYPSLNLVNYVTYNKLPVAERIANSILCMPLYNELTFADQKHISKNVILELKGSLVTL